MRKNFLKIFQDASNYPLPVAFMFRVNSHPATQVIRKKIRFFSGVTAPGSGPLPPGLLALLIFCMLPLTTGAENQTGGSGKAGSTVVAGSSAYLNRILKRGVLIVGMQRDYQPFHIEKGVKGYPGIDVEIARLLGRTLGVKVEFRFLPLSELLKQVSEGKLDLSLGGISGSLDRFRAVDFSTPYLIVTPAALLNRNSLPPQSEAIDFTQRVFETLGDLKHFGKLVIGVKKATTNEKILRSNEDFRLHQIVTFADRDQLLEALLEGKIDVLVGDDIYINSLLHKHKHLINRFIALTKPYRKEQICIVLPRGDAEYSRFIDFFVKEIKRSGRMEQIENRYLKGDHWIKREQE